MGFLANQESTQWLTREDGGVVIENNVVKIQNMAIFGWNGFVAALLYVGSLGVLYTGRLSGYSSTTEIDAVSRIAARKQALSGSGKSAAADSIARIREQLAQEARSGGYTVPSGFMKQEFVR